MQCAALNLRRVQAESENSCLIMESSIGCDKSGGKTANPELPNFKSSQSFDQHQLSSAANLTLHGNPPRGVVPASTNFVPQAEHRILYSSQTAGAPQLIPMDSRFFPPNVYLSHQQSLHPGMFNAPQQGLKILENTPWRYDGKPVSFHNVYPAPFPLMHPIANFPPNPYGGLEQGGIAGFSFGGSAAAAACYVPVTSDGSRSSAAQLRKKARMPSAAAQERRR